MYPNNNELLVSVNDLKNFGVLDANINEHMCLPVVKYVQDEVIHNIIGTKLYEKLMQLIKDDTISLEENECYHELLNGYIFHIMAWKVKAEICIDVAEKVRNIGVGRVADDRFYPNSMAETKKAQNEFHIRADKYVTELGKWFTCKCSCFPELSDIASWWEKKPNESYPTNSFIYFPDDCQDSCKCNCYDL